MRKGFTLIELMIVIAIIAIIAAIAIPNLLESRVTANESAASASLKAGIFAAEVQFQGGGYLDRDQDNVGEYGTIRMLGGIDGTHKIVSGNLRLVTGPLSNAGNWTAATATDAPGRGTANGFFFASYTPSDTDVSEQTTALYYDGVGAAAAVIADTTTTTANNGEQVWAAACLPQEWGNTGRRVFFISSDGQLRSPANSTVQDGVYKAAGATANGDRPQVTALSRAIATGFSTQVAAASQALGGLNGLDNAITNGYPVYSK